MIEDRETTTPEAANENAKSWPPKWAPRRLVALAEIHVLAREAVDWNADVLDADDDDYVSGAETLEFLCDWRERMREQLDRYEAAVDGRSRAEGRSVVKTLTIASNETESDEPKTGD